MSTGSTCFVLLHGFTGSPASFDPLLAHLPPHARILRPMLAGHGPRPFVQVRSWDAEVHRLAELLRTERIEAAHLVGYSLGGRVALGLLQHTPELFAHATLIGAHPGLTDAQERQARLAEDARWVALLESEGLDAFIARWEALPLWSTQSRDLVEAQRSIRRSHTAEGLAHALSVLGLGVMPPADPAALRTPIALVAGEHDLKHRALAESFAQRIRAPLHVVRGAGHNVLAEAPAALADILLQGAAP
jgi:2-succinyl-6-hydroxy-2,4-cyclohexadiene-1-carboxylate synthase